MPRTIERTNPKGENIQVSDDGNTYRNESFVLQFQSGAVPRYGVRNGCFEEEILAVLIDRARIAGETDVAEKLTEALGLLVPAVEPAHAATG